MNNSRLQNELDSARTDMKKMLPQEILDTFEKTIREISNSNIANGLSLGTRAPDFSLPDYTGRTNYNPF